MQEMPADHAAGETVASTLQETDAVLRRRLQDARDDLFEDETFVLREHASRITFAGIADELAKIAAYRSAWSRGDAEIPDKVEQAILQRVEALASAASLCEARTATDAYLLIAFADHLIDGSVGFRGALDVARFQLGQRLLHEARRALLHLGALQGHRPDLTAAFCPTPEAVVPASPA